VGDVAAMNRSMDEEAMKEAPAITCLFLDIGGVLLTNGWDHDARKRAATTFQLDVAEMEDRHQLTVDTYEEGRLTLDAYLGRVVFHQERPFTRAQFRRFMFAQSHPYPEMLELVAQLKARHGLKIVVVSNEGRELNEHRIRTFKLAGWVDSFVCSCFIHIRKPDADIFRLALDIAQAPPRNVIYIENTPMFVEIAESLGIRGILHTDHESTRGQLAALGLEIDHGVSRGTR
jgi:putative hydrolase of the HAD superfamily